MADPAFAVVVKGLTGGAGETVGGRVVKTGITNVKVGKVGTCGANGAVRK
jgi:hypothetical protein